MPIWLGAIVGIGIVQTVSFGLDQWLQHRGIGTWTDYVCGEKAYVALNRAAESLLIWEMYPPSPTERYERQVSGDPERCARRATEQQRRRCIARTERLLGEGEEERHQDQQRPPK